MEFRVLGPVQLVIDGVPQDLRLRRMDRCLLGVLLVHLGTPVPMERLFELLWGEARPERPRQSVQVLASRLRRVLAGVGGFELLTRGSGYVLTGDPAAVDLHRSRALFDQARAATEPGPRADLLRAAIRLHRGPLLGGDATVTSPTPPTSGPSPAGSSPRSAARRPP
ncbi:winged helix-turn-helix domain-containing protein [Longispora sp. K20-0274]|uniref:AfsR/SARP family transcriptional regulator n=1 Tax=Longispora sp. K20-0274 TaxID=3088255 RepID=UPI00399ABD05